jgi:hypothetical protein
MYVIVAGFTAPANNTYWRIIALTSTDMMVYDPTGLITTEVAGAGKSAAISFGTLRATSPRSMMTDREQIESEEVRPSRQVTDQADGFSTVSGSIGFELSLQSQSSVISHALGGTWVVPVVSGSPSLAIAAATPSAGKARITRSTGSFLTEGWRLGDVMTTASFTDGANNRQWQILAVTTTTIDLADPTSVAVTAGSAAGKTITFNGYRMDSKTDLRTLTIERRFNSSGYYEVFKGNAVNELSFEIDPKGLAKGTVSLLGMTSTAQSASSIATTGIAPAPQTGPLRSQTGTIYEGGSRQAYMTALNISLANNRSSEAVIGSQFSPAIFEGQSRLTGSATFFYTDSTLPNKFWNSTMSSITLRLQDPTDATQFMVITIPKVKWLTAGIDPPQQGPVPVSMDFVGLGTTLVDPASATVESNITIQVSAL